jgi:hypothetical protein
VKTEITWTDTAWENFKDTLRKFDLLRAYYGDRLADEHEAEFYRTLQRVTFAAGPVNIQPDGHGFYISFSGFVCGLVWTPDNDARMRERLRGIHGDVEGPVPADWPRTGHWSAHS